MPLPVIHPPNADSLSAIDIRLARESSAALGQIAWTPSTPVDLMVASGQRIPLPAPVGALLRKALEQMAEGHPVRIQPVRPRTPGLEHWGISELEAEQIRALAESPAGFPGRLQSQPKALPSGDAGLLG
jgi:hypothetical protein